MMPKIDHLFAVLTPEQKEIANQIVGRNGKLRSSKPQNGVAAYVWRMVAFTLSNNPQHWCIPVTADFGIGPPDYAHRTDVYTPTNPMEYYSWPAERRADMDQYERKRKFISEELDTLVDAITKQVPIKEQAGTRRWGRAFGLI